MWILFGALVGVPVLLGLALVALLDRMTADWLAEPVTIRAGLSRLEQVSIRPRDALKAAIVLVIFAWLDQFGGFSALSLFGVLGVAAWLVWTSVKTPRAKPDVLVNDLREVTDKAAQASDMLRALSDVLVVKQGELTQMERLRSELDAIVETKRKDAEAWAAISQESKTDLIKAWRRDSQRGWVWRGLGAMVLAVLLNLLATGIWVTAGNPGQEQILEVVRAARQSIAPLASPAPDRD